MNAELEAIRDAMDKSTGEGRDREFAVQLAEAYVRSHSDQFDGLRDRSIEDCVRAVDVFRAAGLDDEQWKVEAWLLAKFEPQQIGGTYHPVVRIPGL